jgi:hypothetical protein
MFHSGKLAGDKHSSLLRKFVIYDRKKFYRVGPKRERVDIGSNGCVDS